MGDVSVFCVRPGGHVVAMPEAHQVSIWEENQDRLNSQIMYITTPIMADSGGENGGMAGSSD